MMNKQVSSPSPLDKRAALRAAGGDPAFLDELIVLYLKDSTKGIARARRLARAGRFKDLEKEAHRLKGASLTLSLQILGKTFADLEAAARDRNLQAAAQLSKRLSAELGALRRYWMAPVRS